MARLARQRVDDDRMAVPQAVHGPALDEVEILAAFAVAQPRARAFDHDDRGTWRDRHDVRDGRRVHTGHRAGAARRRQINRRYRDDQRSYGPSSARVVHRTFRPRPRLLDRAAGAHVLGRLAQPQPSCSRAASARSRDAFPYDGIHRNSWWRSDSQLTAKSKRPMIRPAASTTRLWLSRSP